MNPGCRAKFEASLNQAVHRDRGLENRKKSQLTASKAFEASRETIRKSFFLLCCSSSLPILIKTCELLLKDIRGGKARGEAKDRKANERNETTHFRDLFMEEITRDFGDELDELRTSGGGFSTSKMALLVDTLEAGTDLFGNLEKELALASFKKLTKGKSTK